MISFPIKGTRAPWNVAWFQGWGRGGQKMSPNLVTPEHKEILKKKRTQ